MIRRKTRQEEFYEATKAWFFREIREYKRERDPETQRFIIDMLYAFGEWVNDRPYLKVERDFVCFIDQAWVELFDLPHSHEMRN